MREVLGFVGTTIAPWKRMVKSNYVIKNKINEVVFLWDVIADMSKYVPMIRFCCREEFEKYNWRSIWFDSSFLKFNFKFFSTEVVLGKQSYFLYQEFTADQ